MKIKFWSVYVALISTSLLAQQDTNSTSTPSAAPAAPIEAPAAPAVMSQAPVEPASTNAPAAKPAKKKSKHAKKPAALAREIKTVPLVAGPAVVAANHVNVRAHAGLKGEIIARMTNGEPVTVIEEIRLNRSGVEEPSAWAKIALPEKAHAWVKASYIDSTTKTVIPKKLNLRGGPGENFSVLGTLQHGDAVKEIITKGSWMQIESATNAYAFMAAQYLSQEPAALAAAAGSETITNVAAVTEAPAAAEAGTNAPAGTATGAGTNELAAASTNETLSATNEVVAAEPPAPRIVQREGIVRGATSVQAPTEYELINPENRKIIDYLYTTSPDLDLSRYKGLHIIVTGEEGLDERWKNTPLITIQRIQVIE